MKAINNSAVTASENTGTENKRTEDTGTENKKTANRSAFLQANKAALRELVTFVDFAPEKFTIGFVSVNFSTDQAAIIDALQQHPDCQDVQFVQYTFDDPQLQFLQDELIEKLPKIEREPDKKLVLLLTGLEASIRMVGDLGDYPPMLVDLNYVRDGFTTNVPYPIIIFLPDKALSRLAEFAPDFWAWRRAVVRFESVPDAVKSKMYQAVRRGAPTWLSAEKASNCAALDDRTRRDILPRLLMEYESGSLAQDEEYKEFKSELMADLGISLYNADSLEVAKDILLKSLESEGFEQSKITRIKAYFYLSRIEEQQENYEKALSSLNKLITECGKLEKNKGPYFEKSFGNIVASRADTYRQMERYPEAVADYTRAIDLDPKNKKQFFFLRGYTYYLMECYPEAVTDCTRAIDLDLENRELLFFLRGSTYGLMECYPEAVADFNRLLELDPENKGAISLRGSTYGLMECYPEAVADFNRLLELDPEDKAALKQRGSSYQLMELYPEAVADYTRLIELDPEDKWAIERRGEVRSLLAEELR